jgi:hypothetical protein
MKRSITNTTKTAWLAAALLVLTAAWPVQAQGNLKNPSILPPQSTPGDMTFGEWAAAWWQWAVSIPAPINPLTDTTGQYAGVGQEGPVWFLAGVWGANAPVSRTCTVPAGKMLFFPIVNTFYVGWGWTPEDDVPAILASWREEMRVWLNAQTDVSCEIDNQPVKNLTSYVEESVPFPMVFPEDNLFAWPELATITDFLAVDTGYYLMLAPLRTGPHTIHFRAGNMDVTYSLTVK